MSTHDYYVEPMDRATWDVPAAGSTRFTWEYSDGRERLLSLYQKGKDKQWDAQRRLDWNTKVDTANVMGLPPELHPLVGLDLWERMPQSEKDKFSLYHSSWVFSQFLHGEQGALNVAAHIVESVPDMDSKFYAATQVMDEARHVELYERFIREKIGTFFPINPDLAHLLDESLRDSRWDLPYLGMQVLIEGLALAAFGVYRDMATNRLVKQLLAYIMQDEARHVAFGRLALRDYYSHLTRGELSDREEFVIEGCRLMRDRFRGDEVFSYMGMPLQECVEHMNSSDVYRAYQALLFTRVVPCIRDIGLWGPAVQTAFREMGVLDAAQCDLSELMRQDEEIAERQENDSGLGARNAEVAQAIDEAG